MKLSYIVPIVAVVYFGLHILAYYLTPLFIQGVNMNGLNFAQVLAIVLFVAVIVFTIDYLTGGLL